MCVLLYIRDYFVLVIRENLEEDVKDIRISPLKQLVCR